ALCIVTDSTGSTPRQKGAKMIVYPNGNIYGTIGGGNVEKKVIADAVQTLGSKKPITIKYDLVKDLNMCCGGSMHIYIEPIMNKRKLYIFGAGHTGYALAKLALNFDFDIIVIDDRKEYIDELEIVGINKILGDFNEVLPTLSFDENSFITILTYSHTIDRKILAYCFKHPHAYLGMIGSLRKVEMTNKLFIETGIGSEEELETVDMPMGLNIGAEGPDEIAISIMAKLIAIKNKVIIS
ncbi:MAG: XdhC/CoxI family protein, partial [Bacteroidota bacterium]